MIRQFDLSSMAVSMAQHEHAREDLLAEATALIDRIEFAVDGSTGAVVVGFRRDGCGSVYFGEDPAYHFNTQGELRRAFQGGLLFKAERGRLVSLRRERTASETQLIRHELNDSELAQFCSSGLDRLMALRQHLEAGTFQVLRQVSSTADLTPRVRNWLRSLGPPLTIAATPRTR